nr:hypothetical protein [Wocania ichthyoenteri]
MLKNSTLIPTGETRKVDTTPFDFRNGKPINKHIDLPNEQLSYGKGYDHNFVLNDFPKREDGLVFAAKAVEPNSGRVLEVFTNEPGLQFYGGNFLNGKIIGKSNKPYIFRSAFCLESQHFPNSPNQSDFPSTILKPNDIYISTCVYKFSTVNESKN